MARVDTTPAAPLVTLAPVGFSRVEGDPGVLAAQLTGFPTPALQWFKGAEVVPGATGPELSFPSLSLVDAGSYTLTATNPLGTATTSPAAVVAVAPRPSGLLRDLRGWWKFDETTGTAAADSSAYGNPGLLTNFPEPATHWVEGRVGGALAFRGAPSNDFVRVADYLLPRGPLTVSAWVWADGRPTWASIAKSWPRLFRFGVGRHHRPAQRSHRGHGRPGFRARFHGPAARRMAAHGVHRRRIHPARLSERPRSRPHHLHPERQPATDQPLGIGARLMQRAPRQTPLRRVLAGQTRRGGGVGTARWDSARSTPSIAPG